MAIDDETAPDSSICCPISHAMPWYAMVLRIYDPWWTLAGETVGSIPTTSARCATATAQWLSSEDATSAAPIRFRVSSSSWRRKPGELPVVHQQVEPGPTVTQWHQLKTNTSGWCTVTVGGPKKNCSHL